jgi:hypothetical protein
VMGGRTERLIAVGGSALVNGAMQPPGGSTLLTRMAEAIEVLFERHAEGAYHATYVGYPINYGPRQPAPHDWCIVRRVLDGRRRLIVADGGGKRESRLYVENAAHAVHCVLDRPDLASGRSYVVADEQSCSLRQRIEQIAGLMGHEFELVGMPYEHAWPCHPFWRHRADDDVCDSGQIRSELGFTDLVPAETGLERTVEWLVRNPPRRGANEEQKIGDPFDYASEDELIERWTGAGEFRPIESALPVKAHMYRHPKYPGERWRRPDGAEEETNAYKA